MQSHSHPNPPETDVRALELALAAELLFPMPDGDPLVLSRPGQRGRQRYCVIWDAWGTLRQAQRTEIIINALMMVKVPEAVANLEIAIGLTRIEAERMGIHGRC